jgi:hypothetical protein
MESDFYKTTKKRTDDDGKFAMFILSFSKLGWVLFGTPFGVSNGYIIKLMLLRFRDVSTAILKSTQVFKLLTSFSNSFKLLRCLTGSSKPNMARTILRQAQEVHSW